MVVQGLDTTGNQIGDPIVNDICAVPGMTCPVTSFSIVQTVAISASLTGTYSIVVSILSETGAVLGCAMGTVTAILDEKGAVLGCSMGTSYYWLTVILFTIYIKF
ncbi:hypothetical protein RhiirA4_545491 [Rhizophagus irregularis]|uniref:Phosphatidylglycerol/phosphatidylinositol transfer protein n=1 Tax=Rhizophagus irregularis TaxID=588596 RepID=A0A2I1GT86_9GLOM|nr:hypothetical protein RhiirA4_545491 [Rhizophagus irregularis]